MGSRTPHKSTGGPVFDLSSTHALTQGKRNKAPTLAGAKVFTALLLVESERKGPGLLLRNGAVASQAGECQRSGSCSRSGPAKRPAGPDPRSTAPQKRPNLS